MRHPNLYLRPLEPNDLHRVVALFNAAVPHERFCRSNIRVMTFEDPDYDPELSLVALDGGVIVGFAQGIVRNYGDSSTRAAIKWFATDSSARRTGVMTTLFDRIEDQIQRFGAVAIQIGYTPPSYVFPGVDANATEAAAFLVRRGYVGCGSTHTLRCNLRDILHKAPSGIAGVSIERALRSDLQSVLAFVRNEFPQWTREIAVCFRKNPIGLFLARRAHELIGIASTGGYASGRGWIGPVGVALASRGCGIGTQLLRRSLSDLREQGHTVAVVPYDCADGFFQRACGATIGNRYVCFRKTI